MAHRAAGASVNRNDSYLPSLALPPAAIAARQPGDTPTRERKLKATTFEQVDAARELIGPRPLPQHKARKFGASAIVFEPDHTPADAEARLDPPAKKRKPGPATRSESPDEQQRQQNIRAMRAEISPNPAPPSDVRCLLRHHFPLRPCAMLRRRSVV